MSRVVAPLLVLAACAGRSSPVDPGEGDEWPFLEFWPAHWSGEVSVLTAPSIGSLVTASFSEPSDVTVGEVPALIHDPRDGRPDDCGLAELLVDDPPATGTPNSSQPLDAGDVSVELPDGTVIHLSVDEWLATVPPAPGSYTFSATGADIAAFADVVVAAPEVPMLLAPDPPRLAGDTALAWAGTGDDLIRFEVFAAIRRETWLLSCDLVDDGSFTVPSDLVEILPDGGDALWSLVRTTTAEYTLSDGRTIGATGRSTWSGLSE